MKSTHPERIDQLDWHDHIRSDPEILSGKLVVRGTRLSVVFLLDLLANGWTEQMVLENYPRLEKDDLRALYAFAADAARDQRYVEIFT